MGAQKVILYSSTRRVWEVWQESRPIAEARDKQTLIDQYPDAMVQPKSGSDLTEPQKNALLALVDQTPFIAERDFQVSTSPRAIAKVLWPDSPAWEKRTRKFGGRDPGAVGGTMPMLGAKMLHRLRDHGLATVEFHSNAWRATSKGIALAAEIIEERA